MVAIRKNRLIEDSTMRVAGQKVTLSVGIIFVLLAGTTAANAQADSETQGYLDGYSTGIPSTGHHPSIEYERGFRLGRSEFEENADEDDQVLMGRQPWRSSDGPSLERRGGASGEDMSGE